MFSVLLIPADPLEPVVLNIMLSSVLLSVVCVCACVYVYVCVCVFLVEVFVFVFDFPLLNFQLLLLSLRVFYLSN